MRGLILFFCCNILAFSLHAQVPDTSIFSFPIQMDEVVIKAARNGWDVQSFIQRVKNDTTFYKAFKSLRVTPHSIQNHIVIFGRKPATYKSVTHQTVKSGCREMTTEQETITGSFYERDGDYRYLTAELYAYLFFTKGRICGENDLVRGNQKEPGKLGKYKGQLKQLIFNPGSSVGGVPFMGNKEAIFEQEIAKMYDFKLSSETVGGEECYLFRAIPKSEFAGKVVINELSTWFRKSDYSIIARNYALSYQTIPYTFDVKMKVRLAKVNGKLLPGYISYNGRWRAITKGREQATFVAEFSYP